MFKFDLHLVDSTDIEIISEYVHFFLKIENNQSLIDLQLRPVQLALLLGVISNMRATLSLPDEYDAELDLASREIECRMEDVGFNLPSDSLTHDCFVPFLRLAYKLQLVEIYEECDQDEEGGNE